MVDKTVAADGPFIPQSIEHHAPSDAQLARRVNRCFYAAMSYLLSKVSARVQLSGSRKPGINPSASCLFICWVSLRCSFQFRCLCWEPTRWLV